MKTKEIIEKTIERLEIKIEKERLKTTPNYQKIDDLKESVTALESVIKVIVLNKVEIRSELTRVSWAEGLIEQLPKKNDGRNSWLLNYGKKEESQNLRKEKNLEFDEITQSCELAG